MKIESIVIFLAVLEAAVGGGYEDGKIEGAHEADGIWEGYEDLCISAPGDFDDCVCSYAWNFEEDCDDMTQGYNFPAPGSYYGKLFKKGFQFSIRKAIAEKEEECLNDPDLCEELGQEAAMLIADEFCEKRHNPSGSEYQESCFEVAKTACKGSVKGYVDDYGAGCANTISSNSELLAMQKKCHRTIKCLLGDC